MGPTVQIVVEKLLSGSVACVNNEAMAAATGRDSVLADRKEAYEAAHAPVQLL